MSEITIEFGSTFGYLSLVGINGMPSDRYPFENATYNECKAWVVITKAATSSVHYLGTQSNVDDAFVDDANDVDAIGIYYCVQRTISFATANVSVDAGPG